MPWRVQQNKKVAFAAISDSRFTVHFRLKPAGAWPTNAIRYFCSAATQG